MRAPGLTWFRLPLFVWAHYATSLIMILGTPVIAITLLLLVLERNFHIGIFDPQYGGDPVLFQHLFWFYSHPAVYIMILPGMGVISRDHRRLLAASGSSATSSSPSSRRHRDPRLPGLGSPHVRRRPVDLRRDGLLGDHHAGRGALGDQGLQLDRDALQGRRCRWETPMLYALGFIGLFTIGGLTGVMLGGHRHRRPRARHLLRGRALPLRDGRRRDHGLPRRPALLVAQDHRPHVLRVLVRSSPR